MAGNLSLRSIIEGDNVFNGINFLDWEMNVDIVLSHEKILYTIHHPIPKEPPLTDKGAHEAWQKQHDDVITAQCILLASMTPELHCQNKAYDACTIMAKLRD